MAASEDSSSFFPVFILSIIALPLVPFTIFRLFHKVKANCCQCSLCYSSRKHHNSALKRISRFSTCSNLTLLLLWAIMVILVYHIRQTSYEVQMFEPFSILGIEVGASDSEIKKAYRKLSILYHPDKNRDPEAQKYFVDAISKAYQALTDPTSRQNYEKYGHPDGQQGFRMGIALPHFVMNHNRTSGGILLLGIVGTCILLPLIVAVVYLSRSSKYAENYIMHQTLSMYFELTKPSLDSSKVLDVFIRAAEFSKIYARSCDNKHLQKLFTGIRRELNLGPGKKKTQEANFWKQDPCLIKMTVLIQAQLLRESAAIASPLWRDFNCMLEIAPRLLRVLLQIALLPRRALGHGYLMPALGVIELYQSIIQAVPLSARKEVGGNSEGVAPFLQLPHFNETIVKKIPREKVCTFQELRDLSMTDRFELLTQTAGLSVAEAHNVELVLEMMPCMTIDISCQTDGEEGVQEGDIVTMSAWVNLKRRNKLKSVLPHAPYYPFHKEECFWLLLADPISNEVWIARMVSFMDEDAAVRSASRQVQERQEALGASIEEVDAAVKSAVEKVKSGSRLVIARFIAPSEGTYNLTAYCLCDAWIGCDAKANLTIDIVKRSQKCSCCHSVEGGPAADDNRIVEEENEDEACDDYDSEYSEDDEDSKNRKDM